MAVDPGILRRNSIKLSESNQMTTGAPGGANRGDSQFEQLQMFMTGTELQNRIQESPDRKKLFPDNGPSYLEPMSNLWDRKADEAKQPATTYGHGAGVYDSMRENGLYHDTVVNLNLEDGGRVSDGHHRIAAAAALEKEGRGPVFFPVRPFEGADNAPRGGQYNGPGLNYKPRKQVQEAAQLPDPDIDDDDYPKMELTNLL